MSITFDSNVNSMISQAQSQSSATVQAAAQVQLSKDVYAAQESAVISLINSAGLMTYTRFGGMQSIVAKGRHVEAIG